MKSIMTTIFLTIFLLACSIFAGGADDTIERYVELTNSFTSRIKILVTTDLESDMSNLYATEDKLKAEFLSDLSQVAGGEALAQWETFLNINRINSEAYSTDFDHIHIDKIRKNDSINYRLYLHSEKAKFIVGVTLCEDNIRKICKWKVL